MKNFFKRIKYFSERLKATYSFRKLCTIKNDLPLISFSFDDFPISAVTTGAKILRRYDIKATFYISLGILEQESIVGKICDVNLIKTLVTEKHEIGNHTYNHINANRSFNDSYEKSILDNVNKFKDLGFANGLETFSYPFGIVTFETKQIALKYFRCARTSYRGINFGKIDLNMLKAYPIYGTGNDFNFMKSVIDLTIKKKGWLIFYTHDVTEKPSPFGCTPDYFENVVKYSINSGARLLPVIEAYDIIH